MLIRFALLVCTLCLIPTAAYADCGPDSDCKNGRSCIGGVCRDWAGQCFKDIDCEGSLVCEGGRCGDGAAVSQERPQATTPSKSDYDSKRGTFGERGAPGAGYSLTREFDARGFYMAYDFEQSSGKDEHQFDFPEHGFYVRMDRDGELKLRGAETFNRRLGGLWRIGEGLNHVQVWFDGRKIQMDINGERIGPVLISRSPGRKVGTWDIRITGRHARVIGLVVTPWDGSLD